MPRWSGATARGSARGANTRSAAAKASARTTSDVEFVVLAYAAGRAVSIDASEQNAALRRALFVFAAGGDLHRDPQLDEPAVIELARDLHSPERSAALVEALRQAEGGARLAEDSDLAWRAYACGLLAEAIGEE